MPPAIDEVRGRLRPKTDDQRRDGDYGLPGRQRARDDTVLVGPRGSSCHGERQASVSNRDAVANDVTTGERNVIEARVTAEQHELRPPAPATADIAKELAAMRAVVMSLVVRRSGSILVGTVVTKRTGAPNDESAAN